MKQKHSGLILLLLAMAQLLVILDSAITNVALPAIQTGLHFEPAALQWVLTAYTLTFGGFLLLGGRAADLFGRKKILIGGVVSFTILSLLIGLSQSSTMFIILRALQGLAAAAMTPAALSVLLTTFAEGDARNRALSVWGMIGAGGAAAGVLLGGILTQLLGWQWNFFVNVPIGLLTAYGLYTYLPAHAKEEHDKKLDFSGAILVTGGLMSLVYALTEASTIGWGNPLTISLLGVSAAMIAGFLFNESKVKHPLMPLSIFRIRNVSGANLMMVPIVAGAFGLFFFASQYVQNIMHLSPIESGLCFLPIPIIIGVISNRTPQLMKRFGFQPLLITGTILLTISTFMLSLIPEHGSYVANLLPGFILMAIGMGLSFVSVTVAATSGVPAHEAGLASGIITTSQQLGGSLGVAILASIASAVIAGSLASGVDLTAASLQGYRQAFFWASAMMLLATLVAIFVIHTPKQKASSTR